MDSTQLVQVTGRLRLMIHALHQAGKREVALGLLESGLRSSTILVPQYPVPGSR